jgi:2-polyprenyl-6-methoxyphenol hydroxylase-like FAD-dependent oxidoreductase
MKNHTDVLVVGAGPTGLMLACELALAGVTCRLLERRTEQPNITRAFAVHARTLELLDARGLADALVARGTPVREIQPAPGVTINLGTVPSRYPMLLIAPQSGVEKLLETRARELGVDIVRGAQVVGLRQTSEQVTLDLADGTTESAEYVAGADGAHSTIRAMVGVDFVGTEYETHILLADVRLRHPPAEAMFGRTSSEGAVIVVPFGDGWFRVIAWDRSREQVPVNVALPMAEMRSALLRIAGTDLGLSEQRWSSRFLSERRQARRYRVGRVFLAGDAAHVHSPLGGQGMNTGIQDAFNLGWKLAAAVQDREPSWLLDSYETERHRVGAQVLKLTDGFNRLVLGGSPVRRAAQQGLLRLLVRLPPARRGLVGRLTGLGTHYPAGLGEHSWTGRRAPDVACRSGRLYELLRDGRFVLVDTTPAGSSAERLGHSRPGITVGRCADPTRKIPAVMLVRPDGYIAWAADGTDDVAIDCLAAAVRWCPYSAVSDTEAVR